MKINDTTKVRWWLAETINNIFTKYQSYSSSEITKYSFYIYNLKGFNGCKKISIEHKSKKRLVKLEKWMNYDNLKHIWLHINNRDGSRSYFWLNNLYKTSSKNDVWISLGIFDQPKELSSQLTEIMHTYKLCHDLKSAQALIGGIRKYFNAYRVSIESIFNKKWINTIGDLFNGLNFTHNNVIGEEIHKNGKTVIKSVNNKIRNMSKDDIFRICDYLLTSMDIILKAVENENLLRN